MATCEFRGLDGWRVALCLALALTTASSLAGDPPPRGFGDILSVLESHPVDRARLQEFRQTLESVPSPDLAGTALAEFHLRRARAARELGLVGPEIRELRRVVDLGGGKEPHRAWAELGGAEFGGGSFRSGLAAKLRALDSTPENALGFKLALHAQLADSYRRLGDFSAARQHVRHAEGLLTRLKASRNWAWLQHNWSASVEDALGRTAFSEGRYGEAEVRFRKALDHREQDVAANLERMRNGMANVPQITVEQHRDRQEAWLANTLLEDGRVFEAEVYARRLVYRVLERYGPESLHTNQLMMPLVRVLLEERRTVDALKLMERMLVNLDRLEVGPTALPRVQLRRLRANALVAQRRWSEALEEFEALRSALADDPQLIETLGAPTLGWVRALIAVGRVDDAVTESRRLARSRAEQMGTSAYESAEARGYYAVALATAGKTELALEEYRQALAILLPAAAERTDRSGGRFARLAYVVESYLALLSRIRGTPLEKAAGLDAVAEAFVAADVLRGQSVQQAMAASAARAAAGKPELAALAREEQDVRQERDALYKILADLLSRPTDQMLPGIVADMQGRVAALDGRHRELRQTLDQRFPDYADLVAPRPAKLEQVRAALRPGEALLSILSTEELTFVWAIPAEGSPSFAAVSVGRREIDRRVRALRKSLDPPDGDLDHLPAFDGQIAHRLYTDLLAPVRDGWQGRKHLLVVAGGALARLPLGLLLTADPMAGGRGLPYARWPWLIRDMAMSQLPSAASLLTLRRMAPGAADRRAFVGFGDPDFAGDGARNRPGSSRGLRAIPLPAGIRERALRGEETQWPRYSEIAPLPDTRDEILALADALKADPRRDVFLGAAASRENVLSGDLSRRRVIAFATHGLLPGELPQVEQPALALANPGGGNHGLLTLDDILGLRLDADWVILSACNTAAGEGEGAEALSGLGRAFFYAGGRALLATHWPVESVSARKLVVGVFAAMAREPEITRAEALRRSILAVMSGSDVYAHPLYWAPYALIGDGGR